MERILRNLDVIGFLALVAACLILPQLAYEVIL